MHKELEVPAATEQRRDHPLDHGAACRFERGGRAPRRAPARARLGAWSAPRPRLTSARPASNCGFTSSTIGPPGAQQPTSGASTWVSEMNERSATAASTPATDRRRGRVTDVEVLHRVHPRVVSDPWVELAMADVECDDPGRAALQQAIREAAGRGAGVEHRASADIEAELIECGIELVPAATTNVGGGPLGAIVSPGAPTAPACRRRHVDEDTQIVEIARAASARWARE